MLVRWQAHINDEVSGVTRSHENTTTLTGLVKRTAVVHEILELSFEARSEPNHGHLNEEYLGITFSKSSSVIIPLASFEEHTLNVHTMSRRYSIFFIEDNLEVHTKLVNRDLLITSIVLQSTGEETLSEVELVDPHNRRNTFVNPGLEEEQAFLKILDVASKGFQ